MRFTLAATVALVSSVAASPMHHSGGSPREGGLAPIYTPPNVFGEDATAQLGIQSISDNPSESHIIPNSYIVVMKEGYGHRLPFHVGQLEKRIAAIKERLSARGLFHDFTEQIIHHIDIADFKGYAGHFSEETLDFIRSHPAVDFVERDSVVKAMDVENGAPWGLARISHREHLRLSTL
jgi:cerevisin